MASRDPLRPNIVFVLTDDQGPWALGAAGNHEIVTPTLDQLAAEGTRCDSFFCASPVCSPARASLYTASIPSQHGVHDWLAGNHLGPDAPDFLAGQTTVFDVLAADGYRCGLSGKWHLGAHDRPRPGFVHWFAHQDGAGPYVDAPVIRDGRAVRQPGYVTDAFTADAVQFVEQEAGRTEPFVLALNYTAPHSPWDGHPDELTSLYADCAFETCPQEPEHPGQVYRGNLPAARRLPARDALVGYFAAISGVDRGVAQVLGALDRADLDESTLVIFTSDNGFNCGHHGIWGKGNGTYPQNMFDTSVKVPAILRQPGRIPAGTVRTELLSGYDLAPTLLDWTGMSTEAFADGPGRSFARTLTGESSDGAEHVVVFDEYGPTRMIRTRTSKYVWRIDPFPEEFYDLVNDPDERDNLVADPARAAEIAQLRAQLIGWFQTHVQASRDGTRFDVRGWGQRAPVDRAGMAAFRRSAD